MKQNVGTMDRVIRLVVAIAAAYAGYAAGGALGWVLYFLAGIMLFTAAAGWCAFYTLLGINTSGNRQ